MSTSIPSKSDLQPSAGQLSSTGPQLLVSIRNAHEARLARSAGVDWIDLKNPDGGSLGAADERTSVAVARELSHIPAATGSARCVRSAAVGELHDAPLATAQYLAHHFPLLKVGLSGMGERSDWSALLVDFALQVQAFGANLVPVIYADYELCSAPKPIQITEALMEVAARTSSLPDFPYREPDSLDRPPLAVTRYLLIDTFTKDGRGLLDWMDVSHLKAIIEHTARAGRQVVLAGSLQRPDLSKLWSLPVAAIAVRGAVCDADRRSGLCAQKLRQWVELFRSR